jgi:uncharacterized protein YbjT (DUF2867 family)
MARDVQAASRRLPSGIALRVADYEDASALKRALAGIDGRVAPISRDDVAAAVAAVAAKPNKSRIIYMITGHRALGFGEIAASYGETIVRQVRYRSYSQVSQHFSAITGREPESFRDFLLRATSGSPADCIAGSPFRERHRS